MESKMYIVRPDTPFEANYPLSSCDLQIPPRFIRKAFVYATDKESNDVSSRKTQDLICRLQDSLKSFLGQPSRGQFMYPQLLGRVVQSGDGGLPYVAVKQSSYIQFNVVYRPDIDFESLHPDRHFPVEAIRRTDFAIGLDRSDMLKMPDGAPNFAVQLTFIRGGFVLVSQVFHRITDGYGYAGFIRRWFQRARTGLTIEHGPGGAGHSRQDRDFPGR